MNEAVAALRQEVARSYERSEVLSKENDRLRALVASLQRDLGKSRTENKTLRNQIRALEKRLYEIRTPPPNTAEEEAAAPRVLPQPSTRGVPPPAPSSPPAPPAGGEPSDPTGGDFGAPAPPAE